MSKTLEVIESREAVIAILETFHKARTPVSITTPHSRELFTSYLLKPDRHQQFINQLVPEHGNLLLQSGLPIKLRTIYQGISYTFSSTHLEQSVDDVGFFYHQISLPDQIQYLEKRVNYRTHTKLTEKPVVQILTANKEPVQTRCKNISKTGACLLLPGDQAAFKVGKLIDCSILLPGLKPIKCSAAVMYQSSARATRKGKISEIGIEFRQLQESTKKQIHTALMKMQRHNLRSSIGS